MGSQESTGQQWGWQKQKVEASDVEEKWSSHLEEGHPMVMELRPGHCPIHCASGSRCWVFLPHGAKDQEKKLRRLELTGCCPQGMDGKELRRASIPTLALIHENQLNT